MQSPKAVVQAVQASLSDELRRKQYQGAKNPYTGHCYVASEAIFHLLGGKSAGYAPVFIRWEGEPHWFLRGPNGVIDATASQFKSRPDYPTGVPKGFLTSAPSSRAAEVMRRAALSL